MTNNNQSNFKVFGIGFQKTGTTSLMFALKKLGYDVCDGCGNAMNPNIRNEVYDVCYALAEKHNAFEDHPWSVLYQEMDCRYPNSKFILTIRPTEQWIKSVSSHFGSTNIPLHEWIYGAGCPKGNEDLYIKRYEQHNQKVISYFDNRPNDLLTLNFDGSLTGQELWEKICNFLGHKIPNIPFPYANSSKERTLNQLILNYPRAIKHKIWGKKPIKFLGIKIGKDYSPS